MNGRQQYDFVVLRYIHDIVSREFVNVGVILSSPSDQNLIGKFQGSFDRVKKIFPDFDKRAFSMSIRAIEHGLDQERNRTQMSLQLSKTTDFASRLRQILPANDSALQWSDIGSGVCEDFSDALDRVFTRYVTRYDKVESRKDKTNILHKKKDDDIWRPVNRQLKAMHLDVKFQKKQIRGETDSIEFDRAYKNGQWYAFEPVSFDLTDTHNIKDKARRWLGHLAAVSAGTNEDLKVYFLTGSPQNPSLHRAYEDALKILECAPFEPEIFSDDVDAYVHQIEEKMQ